MKKNTNKLATILCLAVALASCTTGAIKSGDEVPPSGRLEYDIHYSDDINNDGLVGSTLPHSISGKYNPDNIKLSATSAFGILKFCLVCAKDDHFMTIALERYRLIVPLEQMQKMMPPVCSPDSIKCIQPISEATSINGWTSYCTQLTIPTENTFDADTYIKVYYTPMSDGKEYAIPGYPDVKIPGIITAVNITKGKSNVMVVLKKIIPDDIRNEAFERPEGFRMATADDLNNLLASIAN